MTANRLLGHLVVGLALGIAACGGDSLTIPSNTGVLEVTTSTTGTEPDPDGYTLQVDAEQPQAIGASATLQVQDLTPGTHNVLLSGLANNCSVSGDNPQAVTINVGEKTTATFNLVCGATTGALQVTAQTSGPSPDADGYSISLDGSDKGPLGANASVTLSNLAPGSHVVGLSGVSSNCTIQGDNLQAVTVTQGETATITFAVVCVEPPPEVGVLRVTTTTGGPNQDPNGYQFTVDGGQAQPIGLNTSATLTNVAVGSHTVVLSDVAANCTVDGGTSKDATVSSGQTTTVNFNVSCSLIPPVVGAIHVTTSTSGDPVDPDGYAFSVDDGANHAIGINDEASLGNVTPGTHRVDLTGVAGNCAVNDASQQISVTAGGTTEVGFVITCGALQPSATRSRLTVSSNSMPVGGSVAVTVRVRDASGNVIPNVPVTLSATGSGNQINPASDNTDVDGIATFTFSSSVAESKTLSATAGGVALNDTKTVTVFRRTATIRITGDSPDPSAPNETIHVTFEVTGEGGGTPTGTVAVFSLEESGVGCPAAPIDANGQGFCDFAFTTEGGKRIEATYSGDSQFEDAAAAGVDHSVQTPAPTNQAPTSAFAAPTGCTAGTACPFDGTASSDPEGSLATWAWDFGDPFSFDDTGSGSTASHTYFVGGNSTYTVTLTVTDTQGASNSVSHDVTIQ